MKSEGCKISKESVDKLFPKMDIDIMGYESPIQQILGQMRMEQENGIVKAIQEQGVNVDKDELVKALKYDRDQFDKGYVNGYRARAYEVALKVIGEFEEIINKIYNKHIFGEVDLTDTEQEAVMDFSSDISFDLQELKKKYTESENQQ